MQKSGYTGEDIQRRRKAEHTEKGDVEVRQRAYAGWLVTNMEFRQDRDAFRAKWEPTVEALGGFPRLPLSLMGERPSPPHEEYREFYDDYKRLCVTWGLDGLATWDLPCPILPELSSRSLYYLPAIQEAGATLFVPWYLLRDKNIQLDDLAERIRMLKGPDHLKDWLDHKPRNFGYGSLIQMLEIYIFLELCLRPRYSDRLKRNVEKLDLALGNFCSSRPKKEAGTEQKTETIRKVRLVMSRRLRLYAAQTGHQ